jgi:hypothetical protein
MADLPVPIVLTKGCTDRLAVLKDAYNAENGALLDLTQWITLHLRELAISREWSDSVQAIQRQQQADAQSAIRDERTRLLAAV